MPVTDSISDFLTQIRNAGQAKHKTVDIPSSKIKLGIASILKEQGYITDFAKVEENKRNWIRITLRYFKRETAFKEMKRVSKPGRRIYTSADDLPRVNNGLGIAIISTSSGVMSDKQARQMNIGGEVLCTIW